MRQLLGKLTIILLKNEKKKCYRWFLQGWGRGIDEINHIMTLTLSPVTRGFTLTLKNVKNACQKSIGAGVCSAPRRATHIRQRCFGGLGWNYLRIKCQNPLWRHVTSSRWGVLRFFQQKAKHHESRAEVRRLKATPSLTRAHFPVGC